LLLRAAGPLDAATRGQWRALGFALSGEMSTVPIALPPPPDAAIVRTRDGIGSRDMPADLNPADGALPEIGRIGMAPDGPDVAPLLRDAGDTVLAGWRASGKGRVAIWTGIDSYGLILTGRASLYGDWWSRMLTTIARPAVGGVPAFFGPVWQNERIGLCSLSGQVQVVRPDGRTAPIQPDPATPGCGAFWPDESGWHVLNRDKGRPWTFFVYPAHALPAVRGAVLRNATQMLAAPGSHVALDSPASPGDGVLRPWIWFPAWLIVSALLWWLERARIGPRI
jgi:hypothetical protein